jgi:N6-L-threonylcarbamoyladenine synthase
MTLILGIESSCDETAAAVVADGCRILAEQVASQAADFAAWGGVVPELAARGHVDLLPGLPLAVMTAASIGLADLDAIAVTTRPGLIGSLLCGVTCAKALAARGGIDLVGVDHIEAHIAAIHLERSEGVDYPLVALVASGGHSHYFHCPAPGVAESLGGTIDDAAGEAFDKAAAILGLGYPGGPVIDQWAAAGDPAALDLPRSFLRDDEIHLSFAGLKTNLLYRVRGPQGRDPLDLPPAGIADACASFRAAVVDCLLAKLMLAAERCGCRSVAIGGGVACNHELRRRVALLAAERGWCCHLPAPRHCADNGAMVAATGHHAWHAGRRDDLWLTATPTGRGAPAPRH